MVVEVLTNQLVYRETEFSLPEPDEKSWHNAASSLCVYGKIPVIRGKKCWDVVNDEPKHSLRHLKAMGRLDRNSDPKAEEPENSSNKGPDLANGVN